MRPIPVIDEIGRVFGIDAMKILPPWKDIPDEFKATGSVSSGGETKRLGKDGVVLADKWLECVSDWFFFGLKNCKWTPKTGVDTNKALKAISCCIGSWEPSHEHKEAGVAYLLSEWFSDVQYDRDR